MKFIYTKNIISERLDFLKKRLTYLNKNESDFAGKVKEKIKELEIALQILDKQPV